MPMRIIPFLDLTASHREPDGKPDLSQVPLKSGVVQFQGKGEKLTMPLKRISTEFTLGLKKAGLREKYVRLMLYMEKFC